MYPSDWWGHGFGFMWIMPLLFLAIFLFFMRGMFGQGEGGGNKSRSTSAREILDKRFAKGEISQDEYQTMKKALGDNDE
jgi:putative membrane protein